MKQLNTIAFHVVPSLDTNDHEVRIFVDGNDFIQQHWPGMMGMDPDDVLSYRELLPRAEPHEVTVVRCGCGVAECGSVGVEIFSKEDFVIWASWQPDKGKPPAEPLTFSRSEYMQAVKDAVEDHSWETPDRTAARILASLVEHHALALKILNISGRPVASESPLWQFLSPLRRATLKSLCMSPGMTKHRMKSLTKRLLFCRRTPMNGHMLSGMIRKSRHRSRDRVGDLLNSANAIYQMDRGEIQ